MQPTESATAAEPEASLPPLKEKAASARARRRCYRTPLATFVHAEMFAFLLLSVQLLAYPCFFVWVWRPSSLIGFSFVALLLAVSYRLQRYVACGYGRRAFVSTKTVRDIPGKLCIVTGGNTGLGFEVVRALIKLGARVVIASRSEERGKAALAAIQALYPDKANNAYFVSLDLASQGDVREFVAHRLPAALGASSMDEVAVDVLVNNAGFYSPIHELSVDGIEMVVAVNHVSPFLLTELLLPSIRKGYEGRGGRVVNVASLAHANVAPLDMSKHPRAVADCLENSATVDARYYGLSKLCNVMHAEYLADTYNLNAFSVHPGGVLTEVFRSVPWIERFLFFVNTLAMKTPDEGAQTTLQCIYGPISDPRRALTVHNGSHWLVKGGYYADCWLAEHTRHPVATDAAELENFAVWSKKACGLPTAPKRGQRG
jgi:NAD(P)-dependent dehydrogenase (short-subunit alcohol dehydrogenase family)